MTVVLYGVKGHLIGEGLRVPIFQRLPVPVVDWYQPTVRINVPFAGSEFGFDVGGIYFSHFSHGVLINGENRGNQNHMGKVGKVKLE